MAVRTISTRLAIEGEQEYKQKITQVNSELKTLDSELKLVESQFKGQANSMEALTAKGDALQKVYDKQADKVKELEAALKNAQGAQQAYAERAESIRAKITATETALNGLKNSTNDTTDEQKKLVAELNKLQKELEEATAGEVAAAKGVNNWQQQLNSAKIRLNSLNDEIQKNDRYLDEAQKSTDKCAKSIDEYGKEVKDAAEESNLLAKIFAGGFFANIATQALSWVTSKIKELASAAFDTAGELQEMADVTGQNVEELQALKYADPGATFGTIQSSVARLTRSMSEAQQGTEAQTEAFKKLGVAFSDADGSLRSASDVFIDAIGALGEIGNETERDALAMELLGKSAMDLNPLIKEGADGLKRLTDEAKNNGAVMSEDAVKALDAAGDAIDRLGQRMKAFVGEALYGLIGDSKTAAERIEGLTQEMSDTSGVLDLIEKYRELSIELQNTNLSKESAAAKNAELEKTKKDLIEASGGVVTALDIENGTFDEQVGALERATKSQQEYNQYRLESIVRENLGAEARKKAAEATAEYEEAQNKLNNALEYLAEVQERAAKGESTTIFLPGQESVDELKLASESVEALRKILGDTAGKMSEVEENTAAAEDALRGLVNNGFLTAEEAAETFGLSIDELSEILGAAAVSTIGLSDAEKKAQAIVADLTAEVDALQTAYNEAYQAAYDSITSQIGLWEEMDNSVIKSAAEIQKALESQMRWLDNYTTNLTKLSKRQVEGVDELVKSLSDGSTESAAILAGLSIATDEEISKIIKSMKRVDEGKKSLSHTMAEATTDFDKKMEELSDKTSGAVNALNNKAAAQEAAIDTMRGYIDQVLSMIPELEKAYKKAAERANAAYRDAMDMHSPSRKAMEASEDYFEGLILGAEQKQAELERTFAEAAYAADSATRVSLPESTAQIGDQIVNAVSSALGQYGNGQPIQLHLDINVDLEGRPVAKVIRSYLAEESALAGIDLTEV